MTALTSTPTGQGARCRAGCARVSAAAGIARRHDRRVPGAVLDLRRDLRAAGWRPTIPTTTTIDVGVNSPPSAAHWLGTDDQARDILSRIIWGSRIVLTIAPLATLCAYVVGCTIGSAGGLLPRLGRRRADAGLQHHPVVPGDRPLRHHHDEVRAVGAQHHRRRHLHRLAAGGAPRARPDAGAARARICRGRQDARRAGLVHHAGGDPAECARAADRRCLPAHRLHHDHHRHARIPRPRPAAARSRLGRHDQGHTTAIMLGGQVHMSLFAGHRALARSSSASACWPTACARSA